MNSEKQIIDKLLRKYRSNKISNIEKLLLAKKLENIDNSIIEDVLQNQLNENIPIQYRLSQEERQNQISKIFSSQKTVKKNFIYQHPIRWIAAASVLIIVSFSLYILDDFKWNKKQLIGYQVDIKPGGNKAALQLGDNIPIVLNDKDLNRSNIENQFIKSDTGHITFLPGNSQKANYKIATPRGGNYVVTLSDGSVVHLNAASSLRFPNHFVGDKRIVELQGEAFFDVKHQKNKPFIVKVKNQFEVFVTGTQFNVKAYSENELSTTTLIEGEVKIITKDGDNHNLKPGDIAYIGESVRVTIPSSVDEITAWKDGLFVFDRTSLNEIMRQVSLWYDVDITFEGQDKGKTFSGIVDKKNNASDVLKILTLAGIKFEIQGKKIHVIQ